MKTLSLILLMATNFPCLYAQSSGEADKILINSLRSKFALTEHDHLDHIMRFNKDTILISGYLSDNYGFNDVVYQTFDGGRNWNKNHFRGDAWIYDAHFQNDGKVWMGGSDEDIHFSTDYGSTWTRMPKPFKSRNRVLSIYMIDSLNGIAGALHNRLAITNDNWKTAKQIPSPLDQNKFSITKSSARDRIDKVQIIDSIILIEQNEHIYYSKLDSVDWKAFNVPIRYFSVSQIKKTIELFSLRYKVYVLDPQLNLIKTYVEPEDNLWRRSSQSEKVKIDSFLASGIRSTQIKAVKFDFDKMSGGCMPFALYKENKKGLKVNNAESFSALKNILTNCETYKDPMVESFKFSKQDLDDYFNYYDKLKTTRQEEKLWGGDFSYYLDIDNKLFKEPGKTIDSLDQELLDSVYKIFSYYYQYDKADEANITVYLINNNADTLKVTSENAGLFSLPWTITYNSHSFETYDTRITGLLRATLPKGSNYYNKLFAGELIYRLIEQRIINEMIYKKG
ncbi:MAG: hypothetical protein ABI685_01570 [Ferruginibacter sp.]